MTPTDPKNPRTPGPAGATPGAASVRICSACGTNNTSESRFCGSCAAPLKETLTSSSEVSTRTVRASAVELARGNLLADRYEIIEELGRGGMGKVFKVYDHKVNEVIALKLIRPEISVQDKAIERFKNELKFTRKIAHRNICRMFDLGEVEYVYYITMEYVAGEDLKRFVKRAGPLNAAKAVMISGQICDGLSEAHRVGAVHRDLKPQNIMIDAEGNAKIMDFGIARFTEMDRMTGSGVMIGTPEYMSPEQAELADVDARSDIYSLGVVLYEMVTGRVPFEGPTPLSLAMKHKMETPKNVREWNAQIPPALAAIVSRCLEKDANKRYQSAGELKAALEEVERGLGTGERDVPAKAVKTRQIKVIKEKTGGRKLAPVIVAGVLVAAAAGAYFLFLRPTPVSLPAGPTTETATPPAGEQPSVPADSKTGISDLKPAAGDTSKAPVPETKIDTGKPSLAGAGEKAIETKPPAAEAAGAGLKTEAKPDAAKVKSDAAKSMPAEPEVKKPETKPKTVPDGTVKTPPAAKSGTSVITPSDKVMMYAAQNRTVEARNKAVKAGQDMASLFFQAADRAQQDAAVAAAENKIADAESWFSVAEKLYGLCADEGSDRARWRALIKHIDGLRGKALAAWNNVEGDPLFQEAKIRINRGETARNNNRDGEALGEYAAAAFDYEKIRWIADLTKKK